MRNRTVIALILFALSFNTTLNAGESSPGVTLYLKSGEIIKGALTEKTDETIEIEKYGSSILIKLDDVLKIEESKTGRDISASYKLPFKTAIITYECKGYQKGKEVAYIDADKNKIATESSIVTSIGDFTDTDNNLMIYDGNVIYMVDLDENEATRMEKEREIIPEMFGEQLYFGNPVKLETFLGKECKVYQHSMGNLYFWYGILLKEEITNHPMGEAYNSVKEAKSIRLDVDIPADKFEVPKDVQVKTWEDRWKSLEEITQRMQEENKEWQEEFRESLLEQSKEEPEIKRTLEEATKEDGTLDYERVQQLMQEQERKELVEKAKGMKDGDKLIQEATSEEGVIDVYKLRSLLWEKEREAKERYGNLIEVARLYENQGKNAEALDKYTVAIELDPSDSSGYFWRFRLYGIMGDYEKAIQDIERYAEIVGAERGFDYLIEKADLYVWMGKYQEAIEEYTRCVGIFEEQAKEKIGEEIESKKALLEKVGDDESSIDWSEIPKLAEGELARIVQKRGDAYRKMGESEKALDDFTEAIEKSSDERTKGDAYFFRGLVYKELNELSKMRDDWKMAKSLGDNLRDGKYRPYTGKKEGLFIWYYPDGKIKTESNHGNGEQDGPAKWYYRNGLLKCEGNYVNGEQDGEWKWYHEDGKLKKKAIYKNGTLLEN